MKSRVVVLGAGVSGLTVANGLLDRGHEVTVIDAYPEPGGNHLSWTVDGYTFDIGTIYFPEHSPVAEIIPEIAKLWVRADHTVQRITPAGVVRAYPLSLKQELLARSPFYIATVGAQIIWQKLRFKRPNSVTGFVRYYIGDRLLQDSGLLLFMERFYNLPVERVGFSLAQRRMAWIGDHAGLRVQARKIASKLGRIARGRTAAVPDQWYAKAWYVRPREGFSAMYRPAVDRLKDRGARVELGVTVQSVEQTESGFSVTTPDGTLQAERLVSTVPLEIMSAMLGWPAEGVPRSSPLMTMCLRFRGRRGFDAEVLYNFHRQGAWKRLTMHSDFYGKVDGWEYLGVEVTLRSEKADADAAFDEFRAMTQQLGLFEGELELITHEVTRFAYPVYDQATEAEREATLARLHAIGIETTGRQGNFEYIPVASEAIALAREHLANGPLTGA